MKNFAPELAERGDGSDMWPWAPLTPKQCLAQAEQTMTMYAGELPPDELPSSMSHFGDAPPSVRPHFLGTMYSRWGLPILTAVLIVVVFGMGLLAGELANWVVRGLR